MHLCCLLYYRTVSFGIATQTGDSSVGTFGSLEVSFLGVVGVVGKGAVGTATLLSLFMREGRRVGGGYIVDLLACLLGAWRLGSTYGAY